MWGKNCVRQGYRKDSIVLKAWARVERTLSRERRKRSDELLLGSGGKMSDGNE